MRKVRIYIASPYSIGDKDKNVKLQIDATYHLLKLGFNPYMPLYHHFVQRDYPELDDDINWLEIDKDWLSECDMAIRLHPKDENGNHILSVGSTEEERFCKENNILMLHFNNIEEMVKTLKNYETFIEN